MFKWPRISLYTLIAVRNDRPGKDRHFSNLSWLKAMRFGFLHCIKYEDFTGII